RKTGASVMGAFRARQVLVGKRRRQLRLPHILASLRGLGLALPVRGRNSRQGAHLSSPCNISGTRPNLRILVSPSPFCVEPPTPLRELSGVGEIAYRAMKLRHILQARFLQQLGAVPVERFLVKLDAQAWQIVQVKHALLDPRPTSVEFKPQGIAFR